MSNRNKPNPANQPGIDEPELDEAPDETEALKQQVVALEAEIATAKATIAQITEHANNTMFDLAVMRDRYTEELNNGNQVRADLMKLRQHVSQTQPPQAPQPTMEGQ